MTHMLCWLEFPVPRHLFWQEWLTEYLQSERRYWHLPTPWGWYQSLTHTAPILYAIPRNSSAHKENSWVVAGKTYAIQFAYYACQTSVWWSISTWKHQTCWSGWARMAGSTWAWETAFYTTGPIPPIIDYRSRGKNESSCNSCKTLGHHEDSRNGFLPSGSPYLFFRALFLMDLHALAQEDCEAQAAFCCTQQRPFGMARWKLYTIVPLHQQCSVRCAHCNPDLGLNFGFVLSHEAMIGLS